jgi:hypothetical protein
VLTRDPYRSGKLGEFFPLFPIADFSIVTDPNLGWQIGIQANAPISLQKKIAAALIADSAGLKSLDYAYQHYVSNGDAGYHSENHERLDLRTARFANRMTTELQVIMHKYVDSYTEQAYGQTLSEWTLYRIPFSMPILLYVGNRGALYEGIAVARLILEQLSFAYYVFNEHNESLIQTLSANTCVSRLKTICPGVGKLYGWMSNHAHWSFDAHKKSVTSAEDNTITHLLTSPHFKAEIFCVILILIVIAYDVVWQVYHENIRPHKTVSGEIISPTTVRDCAKSLLNEIRLCDEKAEDLNMLATILDIRVVK